MDEQAPVFQDRVEWLGANYNNASMASDKFYEVRVYAIPNGRTFYEERRWGKYGAKGQTKTVEHFSEWRAVESAKKQIKSKLNKGYTRPINALTRLATAMED